MSGCPRDVTAVVQKRTVNRYSQLRIEAKRAAIQEHLAEVGRSMVEGMLNAMLDAEGDRYARRSATRQSRLRRIQAGFACSRWHTSAVAP